MVFASERLRMRTTRTTSLFTCHIKYFNSGMIIAVFHFFAHPTCILHFIANSGLFFSINLGVHEVYYMSYLILKKEQSP
jgi:hypothetical protein